MNRRSSLRNAGPAFACVKLAGSVVNLHKVHNGRFLMTNLQNVEVRETICPNNPHPNNVWLDLENCDVPCDLEPALLYDRIVQGLRERHYTGPVTIKVFFARTTEHINLEMLSRISARIECEDLCMYGATKEKLKNAADDAIVCDINSFEEENGPPGNIMVMSGDKIFIKKLSSLRTSGYTNLAVFRPNTCHQDDINEEVQDSWVWRQLLCLPSEAGKRVGNKFDLDLEPSKRTQRISLSASYYQVSDLVGNKFRALVAFLKKQPGKKISIFFSSCESVKHYSGLLRALGMPFSVCEIHGKQSIGINLKVFSEFKEQKGAHILLCSDPIALGHHVLPGVEWTVRFDVPAKVRQYTSVLLSAKRRGARVMLVLTDSETEILKDMRRTKVELEENKLEENEENELEENEENARVQPQKESQMITEEMKKGGLDI